MATMLTDPSHGSVTLNTDGSLSYTPADDYFGADSFTYTAADVYGASDSATVNITINAVNDAPVANGGQSYQWMRVAACCWMEAAAAMLMTQLASPTSGTWTAMIPTRQQGLTPRSMLPAWMAHPK